MNLQARKPKDKSSYQHGGRGNVRTMIHSYSVRPEAPFPEDNNMASSRNILVSILIGDSLECIFLD
jgi:hypothetical protein